MVKAVDQCLSIMLNVQEQSPPYLSVHLMLTLRRVLVHSTLEFNADVCTSRHNLLCYLK